MHRWILVLFLAGLLTSATAAGSDTETILEQIYQAADKALVRVEGVYDGPPRVTISGIGICYDAAKGRFFTLAFQEVPRPQDVRELQLVLPGPQRKTFPAELLGYYSEAGIGFLQVEGQHAWQALRFAKEDAPRIGQRVISMGLVPGDPANNLYLGTAYVSTKLQTPATLLYVTGGKLTCVGSPVFSADGLVTGLVTSQPYMDYQVATPRGTGALALRGRQESMFFMPMEEFSYVFDRIPETGQTTHAAWLGITKLRGLDDVSPLPEGVTGPAAIVDQIVPNTPAAQAGLQVGDLIVAFQNQPLEQLATPDLTGRHLVRQIARLATDRQVSLTIVRQGRQLDIELSAVEMPPGPEEARRTYDESLGLAVREKVLLDEYLGAPAIAVGEGLVVIGVAPDGPAQVEGLAVNDVIVALNDQPVQSIETFQKVLLTSMTDGPDKAVVLLIRRGQQEPQAIRLRRRRP